MPLVNARDADEGGDGSYRRSWRAGPHRLEQRYGGSCFSRCRTTRATSQHGGLTLSTSTIAGQRVALEAVMERAIERLPTLVYQLIRDVAEVQRPTWIRGTARADA